MHLVSLLFSGIRLSRGGGLEVNILAFYSDKLSSNPAGYFIYKKKTKINGKEAGLDFKKSVVYLYVIFI